MKTLEQYRAAAAVRFWNAEQPKRLAHREGTDMAHRLPLLLISHGMLATAAYAKSTGGMAELLLSEIGRFLSSQEMKTLPVPVQNLDQLVYALTNERSTSWLLQQATAEALTYAGYLKRFAPRAKDGA